MADLIEKIKLGREAVSVKNYYCTDCSDGFAASVSSEYFPKTKVGLRLYVHITDRCGGGCPFCRRKDEIPSESIVDPSSFRNLLLQAAPYVSSIAFTGGEPMLYPDLTDELIGIADNVMPNETEIDLVTSGIRMDLLRHFRNLDRITSLHISRHRISDHDNRMVMKADTPSEKDLSDTIRELNDPGKIVLNCVLYQGGVSSAENIADYLDFSIRTGVKNNCFIGMFQSTDYCREHYVSPWQISITTEDGCRKWNQLHPYRTFAIWNRHADHDWCRCMTGSYSGRDGHTRFYFRGSMNAPRPDFCRQLVYTAENEIRDGFGPMSKVLFK